MTNLHLTAERIVVLNNDHVSTFVCFNFTRECRDQAFKFCQKSRTGGIELTDSNGNFTNDRKYTLLEVDVPNEGNPIGGTADVLIIVASWE